MTLENKDGWTVLSSPLSVGERFTLPNQYKPRTFWEWLSGKPKELNLYVCTKDYKAYQEYQEAI